MQNWRAAEFTLVSQYIEKSLMNKPIDKWQCYHSPTGFAKTNNPIENFNGDLRKHTPIERKCM